MEDDKKWVLVFGSLGDGFTVLGPFATHEDAEYVGSWRIDDTWEVIELIDPQLDKLI